MEPGKAYAFCGTSGAGKSSIMAVLERYYEISEGSVKVGGRDIRGMDVQELRGMMGYVSQEAVLFEDSVKWNLLVCHSLLRGSWLRERYLPRACKRWFWQCTNW